MKIGIETSALSKNSTGTSRYINCLLEQLETTGHELTTFSPKRENKRQGLLSELFNLSKAGIQRNLYRQYILSGEMEREGVECGIFPNYFMPPKFGKPAAIIIHDLSFITHPQFYSKLFVYYYKKHLTESLNQNPVIITVSENSRQQIQKFLGVKAENIFLVQAYSNFQKPATGEKLINDSTPYLLYVGHVEPRKNLDFMIENFLAWKKENKIDIKLIIAGEIWIKSASINLLLNTYMNHPDVEFTGYVEEDVLHKLYSNAAGFVHTSFVEGFGFPVLEAMHYELPIICSKDTGTEEISEPGSIAIDPLRNISFSEGLDRIYSMYLTNEKINYNIKYSPELMNIQLGNVLNILEVRTGRRHYSSQKRSENTEEAIEKTLLYASLFNSGVKRDKLLKYLFDIRTTEPKLESALTSLLRENKIMIKNNMLFINNTEQNFYEVKKGNKKLKKSLMFLKLLKKFPLISVISFSGGTAHYGMKQHDDIDLFIICKPGCVYISYGVIHLFSLIFGLRDVICANYLIDENNLEIKSPRDFYTAHQIISLVPYKNEFGFHKFQEENEWVNNFFPNFELEKNYYAEPSKWFNVFSPLNNIIMRLYRLLYKEKISGDVTDSLKLLPGCLRLHSNDHRLKITSLFENEWQVYINDKNKSLIISNLSVPDSRREVAGSGVKFRDAKIKIKRPA